MIINNGQQFCIKDKSCDIICFTQVCGSPPRQLVAVEHQRLKANCLKAERRNDSGRSYRRECAFIPLFGQKNPLI